MKEYYYCDETNAVHGPMSAARMKALRLSGILREDTKVCRGGSQDWKPYAECFPDEPMPQVKPSSESLKIASRQQLRRAYANGFRKLLVTSLPGLQTVLLLLIAVLMVINMCRTQAVAVAMPEYQYGALHLSREEVQRMYDAERLYGHLSADVCPLKQTMAQQKGWEYVGVICNDGINASWLLMRRTKQSAENEAAEYR